VSVNTGVADPRGNIAVISAGTGLGEAGAFWDGARLHPFASEGGHADFAPRDTLEAELLLYLRERDSHVSWERVVSGPGLCSIYEFLRDSGRGVEQDAIREQMQRGDPPAVISEAALAGRCGLCTRALELFVSLYAAEAGNLALKFLATGGVYLGGGIAPRIVEKLAAPEFMRSFARKDRMQELLQAIPVRVVLNEAAALLGAARYAVLCAGLPDPAPVDAGSGPTAG
jgi:glucokinase